MWRSLVLPGSGRFEGSTNRSGLSGVDGDLAGTERETLVVARYVVLGRAEVGVGLQGRLVGAVGGVVLVAKLVQDARQVVGLRGVGVESDGLPGSSALYRPGRSKNQRESTCR